MYIKILVYMIDNQQVKYKISILFFWLVDRLPFLSPSLCWWGGWDQKRQPGRADFGEVVRPAYPTYLRISHISPHIPHISAYPPSSPHIPHIPICPASQHIPMFPSLIPSRLNNPINFIIFAI